MDTEYVLQPSDLGLILSYKCQCACAHCVYNCGPDWADWMSPESVDEAIQAIKFWQHPFQLHITGGEPFLNFPLLLHAVKTASRKGITVYLETNAGWCLHEEQAARRLAELRDAGLEAILISCSPFHAENIPLERTLMAIRISLEIFDPSRIVVYRDEWLKQIASFGIEEPAALKQYIDIYGQQQAGNLFWQGYGLISGGRSAYRLGHLAPKYPPESFSKDNCYNEILLAPHSHVDLYGNYISGFCGGLSIGSWRNLPQLTAEYQSGHFSPLIALLVKSGPYGLFEMACR